jgi:hypothetical protein
MQHGGEGKKMKTQDYHVNPFPRWSIAGLEFSGIAI